jgi:hypothetical protein
MRLDTDGVAGGRRLAPEEDDRERDEVEVVLRAGERLEAGFAAGFRLAPDRLGVPRVAVTVRTNVPVPPDSEVEAP